MTIQEFRDYMASGKPVVGGGDVHMMFHKLSQEALQITAEINGKSQLGHRDRYLDSLFRVDEPVPRDF